MSISQKNKPKKASVGIAELKKLHEALRESERKINSILENTRDIIFRLSPLGIIQYVSPKVEEFFGYKPEDLIGKHFKKTTPTNEIPKALGAMSKVLSGKVVVNLELNQLDVKGKVVPMEINVVPVKEKGKIVAIQGNMRDITERKKAQEALQESEAKFRNIFNNLVNGILLAEPGSKKFYMGNPAICRMLGYSPDEIKDLGVTDIHPKKDLPYIIDQFERQAKGEFSLSHDLPVKRKDGSVFYADVNSIKIKIAGKEYLLGFFYDVTKHKQAIRDLEDAKNATQNILEDLRSEKENIAQARAKDEAILRGLGDGMIAVDGQGHIVTMSEAAERMLGQHFYEIKGKIFYDIVPLVDEKGEIIPEEKRPSYVALATGKTTTTTTHFYKRNNGTIFPVVITATPIILGGKIIGVINVFRDVTKEKEIEKLRQDFLSLASHQLRTPLSGTKWMIETMQRAIIGPLNTKQKEYLNEIYQINERMIRLVSDMLNVLQLEGGVIVIKLESIPVTRFLEELLSKVKLAFKAKWIVLRSTIINHKELKIEADPALLEIVLECFLSNAINYSKPGQEVIFNITEETNEVVFSVKDSGIGIPKDEQKGMFERFFRASNAKVLKPSGTGLGLYIASFIAEKIGGKISFESEENKGSTFYLRIPKKYKK